VPAPLLWAAQACQNKKAMGKKNWSITHYRAAETELGKRPEVKISFLCDPYDANAEFAGIIVYAFKDSFKWTKDQSVTGFNGQFAYVVIKDTGKWSKSEFTQAGQGRVHDAMFRKVMKGEFKDNVVRAMMKATAVPSQSHCDHLSASTGVVRRICGEEGHDQVLFKMAQCDEQRKLQSQMGIRWKPHAQ
jgi:hypothetical protein